MAAAFHGRVVQAGSMTLDELFERCLSAPARGGHARAASTCYQERKRYERHVSPVLGDRDITTIRAVEITNLYDGLLQDSEVGGVVKMRLKPKSVHRVHEQLRAMFAWAKRREFVRENVVTDADCPAVPLSSPKAPSMKAVEVFLKHLRANDLELWLAVRLTATLATRRSELIALRWSDVDMNAATVRVERGLVHIPKVGLVETETKTGEDAAVTFALDDELVSALKEHFEACQSLAKEAEGTLSPEGFIFSSDVEGQLPWHPDTLSARISREKRNVSGAAGISFKTLRAFVATELEADGAHITTAQAVLRHRSSVATARYYRAAREDRLRRATEGLGTRLGGR